MQVDLSQSQTQRSWLEFHDSDVTSIATSADEVWLHLDAYVHRWEQRNGEWAGTGWTQPVTITVRKPSMLVARVERSVGVSAGRICVNDAVLANLIPLPFEGVGAVRVMMQLVDGQVVHLDGDRMTLAETGEARFVEDLRADLRPPDLGVRDRK